MQYLDTESATLTGTREEKKGALSQLARSPSKRSAMLLIRALDDNDFAVQLFAVVLMLLHPLRYQRMFATKYRERILDKNTDPRIKTICCNGLERCLDESFADTFRIAADSNEFVLAAAGCVGLVDLGHMDEVRARVADGRPELQLAMVKYFIHKRLTEPVDVRMLENLIDTPVAIQHDARVLSHRAIAPDKTEKTTDELLKKARRSCNDKARNQ